MENSNISNQTNAANLSAVRIPRMLPVAEVEYLIGLSNSTIYEMMNEKSKRYDPTFPIQVRISKGRVAWVESEIGQWIEDKIANRFK